MDAAALTAELAGTPLTTRPARAILKAPELTLRVRFAPLTRNNIPPFTAGPIPLSIRTFAQYLPQLA